MNRNEDFDQRLGAWLRREAPPQAPTECLTRHSSAWPPSRSSGAGCSASWEKLA